MCVCEKEQIEEEHARANRGMLLIEAFVERG